MEDLNIKEEVEVKQNSILFVGFDYVQIFSIVVSLKKQDFILKQTTSLNEAFDILQSEKFDLIILDKENIKTEIDEFVKYCKDQKSKILTVSNENIDEENHIHKEKIKEELNSKLSKILGK